MTAVADHREDLEGYTETSSPTDALVGGACVCSYSCILTVLRRRQWQPTPVLLPGESQGWEPGGMPSMGSHRVGHD